MTEGKVANLLERVFMFLEDGDWQKADEYCEKILDIDCKNADAYLGKLMAEFRVKKREDLKDIAKPFDNNNNYEKAVCFGDDALKSELESCIKFIKERNRENLYLQACNDMQNPAQYIRALRGFEWLADEGYKDSGEKASETKALIENDEIEMQKKKDLQVENRKKILKKAATVFTAVCAIAVAIILVVFCVVPAIKYNKAEKLAAEGRYSEAIAIFTELGYYKESEKQKEYWNAHLLSEKGKFDEAIAIFMGIVGYKDSAELINVTYYNKAKSFETEGEYACAAVAYGKAGNYSDARDRCIELWDEVAVRETVSAGYDHTVAIKNDGTVVATEYIYDKEAIFIEYHGQCDVNDWTDIVAVAAGGKKFFVSSGFTVGLKSDGTVVATGYDAHNQCNVNSWRNIVAIAAGGGHTVGLKSDGTVVAVGTNDKGQCDVEEWTDIVAVSAGDSHTVGLKSDGTVVAVGNYDDGRCNVSTWTDIVAVSAGFYHTAGLKSDGTVVAVGYNRWGPCYVDELNGVVAVSAGSSHTVGLKSDGTAVVAGIYPVDGWNDIVAVSAGFGYTVGLKSDGTVVATEYTGDDYHGECNVEGWTNIKLPNAVKQPEIYKQMK